MKTAVLCFVATAAMGQQGPFSEVPPAASDALVFDARLPEFEAKDIAGRTWRLEDLRGKHTLVFLWNTFVARGKDKLPAGLLHTLPDMAEVQRVHDEVKGSKNIQVLALCVDYDYTHAPEYMKTKAYDFPVIADWVAIRKLFPDGRGYFVVDPEGRVSKPFRSWSFGRVALEVQRAAGSR